MTFATMDATQKIAHLNDLFRQTLLPQLGRLVYSDCVRELGPEKISALLGRVIEFNSFTDDNNPHGERDFGSFEFDNETYFWKMDYYDKSLEYGSEDPSDPKQTTRVLTVMLASEY